MKASCDACKSPDLYSLYKLDRIPVFLNKLYASKEAALSSPAAKVTLVGCSRCGLIFNADFQDALMDYDKDYIQSQGHSSSFRDYTRGVLKLFIQDLDIGKDKVVEIGCGKEAYFLNMLLEQGVDIVGFDPVYEGTNPRVTKGYFNRDAALKLQANAVVIRHTLDLLEHPLDFLLNLKELLPAHVTIFIEAPRFEWILETDAFWDVSHEICNYFTEAFFQRIFAGKAAIHRTFSNQYMIVKAHLGDLVSTFAEEQKAGRHQEYFKAGIPVYRDALRSHKQNYVWGAGAKGSAFANILDPEAKHIRAVVDINKQKQGRFVPLTGHPCVAPEDIHWGDLGSDACLWIMNENYKAEILASIPEYTKGEVVVLGEAHRMTKAA